MFEGINIIRSLKKLSNDTSNIPASLVSESEHLVKQNFYSAEDVAVMILQTALNLNYITRDNLKPRGEMLISEIEKYESENE